MKGQAHWSGMLFFRLLSEFRLFLFSFFAVVCMYCMCNDQCVSIGGFLGSSD